MRQQISMMTARAMLLLLVVVVGVALIEAQTTRGQKKTTRGKQPHAHTAHSVHADTATASRGDSLRAASPQGTARHDSSLQAATAAPAPSFQYRKIPNDAFGVGERLVFSVNYGFITAGTAVMSIPSYDTVEGRKCYRVEFTVNSHPSFAWVYKVEDRYETFIDVEAIAPLKFEQHIREGTYRRDFVAEFDQVHHIARTTEGQYHIPDYVHDIMSAFYYARTFDFANSKPGDQVVLHNFYKDTSYVLAVRFLGRQELEVEAGTFNTVVVEPLVKEGGLFKSEGRIVIWLSDDDRKIPVRVNTKIAIGSIDTELTEYSGLIGPLRSRIK